MSAVSASHIALTSLVATAFVEKSIHTISQSGRPSTYPVLRGPDFNVVDALLADV